MKIATTRLKPALSGYSEKTHKEYSKDLPPNTKCIYMIIICVVFKLLTLIRRVLKGIHWFCNTSYPLPHKSKELDGKQFHSCIATQYKFFLI